MGQIEPKKKQIEGLCTAKFPRAVWWQLILYPFCWFVLTEQIHALYLVFSSSAGWFFLITKGYRKVTTLWIVKIKKSNCHHFIINPKTYELLRRKNRGGITNMVWLNDWMFLAGHFRGIRKCPLFLFVWFVCSYFSAKVLSLSLSFVVSTSQSTHTTRTQRTGKRKNRMKRDN